MAKNTYETKYSMQEVLNKIFDPDRNTIDIGFDGGGGAAVHTAVNVTASDSTLLAANTARRFLLLINSSDTDMYLTLEGTAAALNTGIRINANGGSAMFDSYCPVAAIKGIHGGSGNKVLLITYA